MTRRADEAAFLWVLGRRVRVLRAVRELSQEQLAEAAGFSRNFVSMVERGVCGADLLRARRLAEVLGVPPSMLVADQAEGPALVAAGRPLGGSAAKRAGPDVRRRAN